MIGEKANCVSEEYMEVKNEGYKRRLPVGFVLPTNPKQGSPAYGKEDSVSRA